MGKIKKSRLGFTIIELMMTTLVFAVLVLAVGSMLIYGWQGWKRTSEWVRMQRDASLAILMISKEIRNATYDTITEGSGISFVDSGFTFSESGKNIIRNDGVTVVGGWLTPGTFVTRKLEVVNASTAYQTNQWIEVEFTLHTTTETEPYSIKVSPRN